MTKFWYALDVKETLNELKTDEKGLDQTEAQHRLSTYGPNELKKEKGASPIKMFLGQFTDILMIILLIATGLSLAIGEIIDATIIFIIIIASASLGFFEEYRSEKAVEALKRMAAPTATVLRDGKEIRIPATELVPGDVILVYTGDKIPADARLIETFHLKLNEASLTGESAPVTKDPKVLLSDTQLNDRKNMVYTGTIVAYGRAKAIVTDTGMNTEFGKIAKLVQTTETESTPLEKRMATVGKWIGILSIVVCIGVGGIGILGGRNPIDMLLWAISLAVAAVPEALPAIVTGALAVGMYRMAKVNTIVKRLPAVETLGCTSVICSDKTGTMTKGEMTVQRIHTNGTTYKVTGVGYAPEGEFTVEEKKTEPDAQLKLLLKIATLCNDSGLDKDTKMDKWVIKGDPTEGAIVVAAAKADVWKEDLDEKEPRIAEIPFSSERKCMTTVHLSGNEKTAYMKGAPEIVLQKCSYILLNGEVQKLTEENKTLLLKVTESMALDALRNLGFAYKKLPKATGSEVDGKIEFGFIFVGIMGMIDPPRKEVKDAIRICAKAGIKVIMITGDHKLTATAVAKELHLLSGSDEAGKVLTGQELEDMTDEQLAAVVENVVIYARVSPEHKMRIVKAWKAKDQIVAMTGDGVNDAPALKMSDIGISMGISGTEVTKEASDMVLADDNFASIVKAVKEGREIYDNIKKYLTYLLRCNVMEILVMFIAVVSVPYLANILSPGSNVGLISDATVALTAVQLLWVNLTTDGLPAIALGVDPGDPDLMERKPRNPKESIFTRDVKLYLTLVPILMTTLLLFGFFFYRPWESSFQLTEARTQLLTAMILMELANAISARSLKYPVFKVGVFKNKFLWYAILSSMALQLFILYTPGIQGVFGVNPPELLDWAFAILFTIIVFGSLEIGKYVASKRRKQEAK